MILTYLIPIFFFIGFIVLLYMLLDGLRPVYRVFSKVYLTIFLIEMSVIIFLDNEILKRVGLRLGSGIGYLMAIVTEPLFILKLIVTGNGNDFLFLLLLPCLPAISAFLLVKYRVDDKYK